MTIDRADAAWAAGLFEGEGTWGYQPNSVRAELAMTDHDVVRRFHAIVGVGALYSKKKYSDKHQDQLVWRVTNREGVRHVLAIMSPWLSRRRFERGVEVLALQAEVTAGRIAERERKCKNGHLRTPQNTGHQVHDGRVSLRCRECDRQRSREYRAAVLEEESE